MSFDTGWWWGYQSLISDQFGFSHIREEVASRLASRILVQEEDIANQIRDRDMVVVGAGILPSTKIPESDLVVADGALRACLERGRDTGEYSGVHWEKSGQAGLRESLEAMSND